MRIYLQNAPRIIAEEHGVSLPGDRTASDFLADVRALGIPLVVEGKVGG